jgi:hypothetical protein
MRGSLPEEWFEQGGDRRFAQVSGARGINNSLDGYSEKP